MAGRGKGEGSIYKEASGLWAAVIPLPPDPVTGKRRRKYVRAKSKAEAVRKMRAAQLELARTGDISTGRGLTLAEWLDRWIEQDVAPRRKPATTADYKSVIRVHINPAIGSRRVDQLTAADVRALHARIAAAGASTSTAAKVHRVLRAALAVAEREEIAPRNIARLVKAPPAPIRAPRAMTADEARHFLAARTTDRARWMVSLMLGVRQGEALGMTLTNLHLDVADGGTPWVDLAWELRRVTWAHGCGPHTDGGGWPCRRKRGSDCPDRTAPIPDGMEAEQAHGGLWLLRPKTVGSNRRVALPTVLADALAEHIEAARPTRFVFESSPGLPIDPRRDYGAWKAALAEEGLPEMSLHSARHTCATLLLEAGVPLRTAQEILGQTQALTTARYQHPSLGVQAQALDAVAGALT
ncbi:tyrosine-type recombinase/integrase [Actinomyces procaprae]|uniref:tyrosine-type recombinase/integrase n=1 Tax=Actinomyces procaprae TaxID=2560010 RepID=UPI0014458B32|nr:site-specific integrase [Actinomyces procaprae]